MDQLAAMLKGEIKDWSEVGGTKAPIVVISEKKGGGIRSMVESKLLNKGEIKAKLREVPSAPQANQIAAQLPNALALTSKSSITDKVAQIETDGVIAQPLNLVTLGEPSAEAAKIIEAARERSAKRLGLNRQAGGRSSARLPANSFSHATGTD